jgi:plasmid stabilization system protein ParE
MYRLEFHEEAEMEFNQLYVWYGLQQDGLEERFKIAVNAILQKIQINPRYFSFCKKPYRQALIKIFPFAIVFKINERDKSVFVPAIYHTHRNPKRKFRKR